MPRVRPGGPRRRAVLGLVRRIFELGVQPLLAVLSRLEGILPIVNAAGQVLGQVEVRLQILALIGIEEAVAASGWFESGAARLNDWCVFGPVFMLFVSRPCGEGSRPPEKMPAITDHKTKASSGNGQCPCIAPVA